MTTRWTALTLALTLCAALALGVGASSFAADEKRATAPTRVLMSPDEAGRKVEGLDFTNGTFTWSSSQFTGGERTRDGGYVLTSVTGAKVSFSCGCADSFGCGVSQEGQTLSCVGDSCCKWEQVETKAIEATEVSGPR